MDTPTDFGTWLRRVRGARDLTQDVLAEAVGCATQTIRSFEIGRRRPSRPMVARIMDVLEVPAAERERILRLARAQSMDARPAPAPVGAATPPRVALRPAPLAISLIGRQGELARLREALLIAGRRLVTVVGPGGIGKTCIALQCAADLADHFADGAAFVALAAVTNASTLVTTIAQAVGCPLAATPNPVLALHTFLRDRELLLVLDNIEQLLGPATVPPAVHVLGDILEAAPQVRIVVTSRERLRRRDEWVVMVDGLAVPDDRPGAPVERSEAVVLFLDRARQVDASFALTPRNQRDVARICRHLGGVPLAIELAAAWVRLLSCAEIAAEVVRDVDFLSAANGDLPLKHRSVRAVLDYSWQLLGPAERHLLAYLAVFSGGCRRDAIAAVLPTPAGPGGVLPVLAALVDASLVRGVRDADGTTRFTLHEFVRQYAATHLDGDPQTAGAARARHAAYYAAWLAAQEAGLKSARQRTTGETIAGEIANIRAAWQWACTHRDASLLRQMLPTLDWFYELRGWYDEAASAFGSATDMLKEGVTAANASADTRVCYWLTHGRAGFHTLRRDPALAVRRLAESVAALRTESRSGEQIHCLKGLAYVTMFAGDYTRAEQLLDEARAIAVAGGDEWNLAMTLVVRGVMEVLRSEPATARQHLIAALEVARVVGDPRPIAMGLTYLGLVTLLLGDVIAAERFVREAHVLAAEHEDRFQVSLSLQILGRIALARTDLAEAAWLLRESLGIAREIGDRWLEAQALGCQGELAVRAGDLGSARERRRSALAAAVAAPLPIALDEAAGLAELERTERPAAALTALAYVLRHPLTRSTTRIRVMDRWTEATRDLPPEQRVAAEIAAQDLSLERPADLLELLSTS